MEAIVCATSRAAECLERPDVGALAAGRLGDAVVLEGDPLQDVRLLEERRRIRLVIKDGRVVRDAL
jgi:imidazolonepropionase-like amidohydrolase